MTPSGTTRVNDNYESKSVTTKGTETNIKIDFFDLYGIPKFDSASDQINYGGFLPIHLRSTSWYGGNDTDDDNDSIIEIILPMTPSVISDTVSVNFSSNSNGSVNRLVKQFIARGVEYSAGSVFGNDTTNTLTSMLTTDYDPSSLSKSLDLEFKLPLINTNLTTTGRQFSDSVMSALGTLEGLVYPRAYGFAYPRLLAVTIGGLYTGFKAFLSNVSIKFSEDLIDVKGVMFPQIISGSLRFVNTFFYMWGTSADNNLSKMFDFLNLYKHPGILFGMHGAGNRSNISPSIIMNNVSFATTPEDLFSTPINLTDNINTKTKDLVENAKTENIGTDNKNSIINGVLTSTRNNIDLNYLNNISEYVNGIPNHILENNLSGTLFTNTMNTIDSIKSLLDYEDVFKNININDFRDVVTTFGNVNSLYNNFKTVFNNLNLLNNLNNRVSKNSTKSTIIDIYNSPSLDSIIEEIHGNSNSDLNSFSNVIGAVLLQNYYMSSSLNIFNDIIDADISDVQNMAQVGAVIIGASMLMQSELIKNSTDTNDSLVLLQEKAESLYHNNLIDKNSIHILDKINQNNSMIDYDYNNTINDFLFSKLTDINNSLS